MNLPVVLTQEAEEDFDSAADWYQQQGGLGAKFTAGVREALQQLHAVLHRDVRRVKLRKFPYSIYFRILADRLEVIAVLPGKRDPSVWRSRA